MNTTWSSLVFCRAASVNKLAIQLCKWQIISKPRFIVKVMWSQMWPLCSCKVPKCGDHTSSSLSATALSSLFTQLKGGKFCITKSRTREVVGGVLPPPFFFYHLLVVLAIWLFVSQMCMELFRERSTHRCGVWKMFKKPLTRSGFQVKGICLCLPFIFSPFNIVF